MHETTKNLQDFYDAQAEKFSGTRQRERPEFSYILEQIKNTYIRISQESEKQTHQVEETTTPSRPFEAVTKINKPIERPIRILDLWCGDGRFLTYIKEQANTIFDAPVEIVYTWVDISLELLRIAEKNHPEARRVHQEMAEFLKHTPQESFDVIIWVASFHHLPTKELRNIALGFIYYALQYEGSIIFTNWCYSDWFKNKFQKEIKKARVRSLYTFGKSSKNDILVPRKDNWWLLITERLYHIFSKTELENLFKQNWFSHIEQFYITTDGEHTQNESRWRNLFTVARKSIWE